MSDQRRVFVASLIVIEFFRPAIMHGKYAGQDLLRGASILVVGLPDEDALLLFLELFAHRRLDTSEKHGLEAEVVEHGCVGFTVAEGIEHPSDARSDAKVLPEEIVAHVHVDDHVFVVRASLISGRPAALGDL